MQRNEYDRPTYRYKKERNKRRGGGAEKIQTEIGVSESDSEDEAHSSDEIREVDDIEGSLLGSESRSLDLALVVILRASLFLNLVLWGAPVVEQILCGCVAGERVRGGKRLHSSSS